MDKVKRIVVKVGTSSLTYEETGNISFSQIDNLARQISDLKNKGYEVILVSSGAIASGLTRLKMKIDKNEISNKQALACIGQSFLIELYNKFFLDYGYTVGQLLLTKYIFDNKTSYLNAQNTITRMLSLGIIPIINENDAISIDEIKLGDNDNLSSLVAILSNADLLILLSDIDGLYDKDPHIFKDAKLIKSIKAQDLGDLSSYSDSKSKVGTGGILTKLKACVNASNHNIKSIIANSRTKNILNLIIENKDIGTRFE